MSHLSLSALFHRPSVTTSAASQFSSMKSIPSSLWSHSSFSLGEASVAGEGRADLLRTQCHQVAPEAPGSEQQTRSILDSLIAGQAAHDRQIKQLMEMLSSSRPLAGQVSVCQLCRKAHPGKMKGKKTQEETQVTPGDSSASSNHNKMPVVWLLPADGRKTQDGMGKTAPTMQPKMVSVAMSKTGLSQAGEKATGSPDGSPPKPAKASRARTPSPSRSKDPVLKRILMCLKKNFSKLQNKVKSQMSGPFTLTFVRNITVRVNIACGDTDGCNAGALPGEITLPKAAAGCGSPGACVKRVGVRKYAQGVVDMLSRAECYPAPWAGGEL
ncbi:uncharacterized protein LOC112122288 isoform X2 [Terrapene carolina triunguis]|uniref:uncharacterized protein LOC112122288 isoform X2 n=1 Tax=Terrapene triunguis TaxID=2587831 RepID=UPI000E776CE5|nr:uncharacterized protein LOC112122288 isoform X2 [Terrapene carolina triunguis]